MNPLWHLLDDRGLSAFYDQESFRDARANGPGVSLEELVQAILSTRGGAAVVFLTPDFFNHRWPLVELALLTHLHRERLISLLVICMGVEVSVVKEYPFVEKHCKGLGGIPMETVDVADADASFKAAEEFVQRHVKRFEGCAGKTKSDSFRSMWVQVVNLLNDDSALLKNIGCLSKAPKNISSAHTLFTMQPPIATEDDVDGLIKVLRREKRKTADIIEIVEAYKAKWLTHVPQELPAFSQCYYDAIDYCNLHSIH